MGWIPHCFALGVIIYTGTRWVSNTTWLEWQLLALTCPHANGSRRGKAIGNETHTYLAVCTKKLCPFAPEGFQLYHWISVQALAFLGLRLWEHLCIFYFLILKIPHTASFIHSFTALIARCINTQIWVTKPTAINRSKASRTHLPQQKRVYVN